MFRTKTEEEKLLKKYRKSLIKSQQGELDAVLLYQTLARKVRKTDRDTFRNLAKAEGYHASFFKQYTGKNLKPKKTKAIVVPILYRLLGRKRTYRIIADGEYSAAAKYEHLIPAFPGVQRIKDDEDMHGDAVLALLK